MSVLHQLSASEIRRLVATRETSAEEVTRAHLDRLQAVEPKLDAYLEVLADRAIDRARALDASLTGGAPAPALAGVPVAVKDILDMDGLPTTCGSRMLEGFRPPFTATAVRRLESAGAIVLGKTNMDEFAMGSSTENSAYKKTRNPWDPARVPGGSSGGSAVAVAAATVPVALGTDTGGSIRQPAALCGVVGLKPTYGRVSRYGVVAFASSLDQVGPITRSVEDAALLASVLFGQDPLDATSAQASVPDFAQALDLPLQGLRLGVPRAFVSQGVDPGVLRAFDAALKTLTTEGAQLVDVELPHFPHAVATYYIVATAEASSNLARYDGVRYGRRVAAPELRRLYGETRDAGFGPEVKRRIILGTYVLSSGYYDAYYLRAQKVRNLIRQDFTKAFEQVEVIVTPTAPTPAFKLGEKADDPLQMYLSDIYTISANLAGICGLSVPCGFTPAGLPVGLQILGPAFGEARVLRVGSAYQKSTDWHRRRPALAGGAVR
jgi:aspartyl-tRNA(Asn)/glutamyl-tRNA(Gln) amidotransferase subunit A